jgi:ribose transport system substrate-binding protein
MNKEKPTGGTNRRVFIAGSVALASAAALWPKTTLAQSANRKFAAALGWTTYDSGRHLQHGFQAAVAELGGTLTITDAGFDARAQSNQIDSLVATKPDALADAVAIKPAVQRAIAAGIPVFCADSLVPGAMVTCTAMANNYGMGQYSCEYICKALNGKGKIGRVMLPQNESWDERTFGMEWTLRRYPDIKVVAEWAFALAGNVTPRQAVDNILTSHPEVRAIWCAWDGAATEGTLAALAAGRKDLILTGIDGGTQSFSYIQSGTPLKLTLAQSFFEEAYSCVYYAHRHLSGHEVPRLIIAPVYAVTQGMLKKGIPDNYDVPGEADKLGWTRAL